MPEDISLLPREVEEKQKQEARGELLRKVSLAFLSISLLFSLSVFVYFLSLKSQLSGLDKSIVSEKSKIGSLSKIENDSHDLEVRVKALRSVFEERAYFSELLQTLSKAVPADVSVTEMTVPSAEAASISGASRSYFSLASFLLNLKETGLFGAVTLRSVSLDDQTGDVSFDLTLEVVEGGLTR